MKSMHCMFLKEATAEEFGTLFVFRLATIHDIEYQMSLGALYRCYRDTREELDELKESFMEATSEYALPSDRFDTEGTHWGLHRLDTPEVHRVASRMIGRAPIITGMIVYETE